MNGSRIGIRIKTSAVIKDYNLGAALERIFKSISKIDCYESNVEEINVGIGATELSFLITVDKVFDEILLLLTIFEMFPSKHEFDRALNNTPIVGMSLTYFNNTDNAPVFNLMQFD